MTTWTPKTKQPETWTVETVTGVRAYDPAGFSNSPDFDTRAAGVWSARSRLDETWTVES